MEILDVVNANDVVIGQATREECHNNPQLIHHTVHFTLFDKQTKKILITQRSFKKTHDGGKFCFLGEHILVGETYEDALKRGLKEELGFDLGNYREVCKNFFKYDKQSEIVKFYIAYYSLGELYWDKNELEDIIWVDISMVKKMDYDISEMARYWVENIDWSSL